MPIIINTDQPSTGKSLKLSLKDVPVTWVTLAEVPIFSIPRISSELLDEYVDDREAGVEREFVLGEIFMTSPLLVSNKLAAMVTIEVRILSESDEAVTVSPAIMIPPNDGVRINIQGQVMTITGPSAVSGDRLQIKASAPGAVDVFGSAVESVAANHAPNTETV